MTVRRRANSSLMDGGCINVLDVGHITLNEEKIIHLFKKIYNNFRHFIYLKNIYNNFRHFIYLKNIYNNFRHFIYLKNI